jgi:hypothetical protein
LAPSTGAKIGSVPLVVRNRAVSQTSSCSGRASLLGRVAIALTAGLVGFPLLSVPSAARADEGYVLDGPTQGSPAAPLANSVTAAETFLPSRTPDYFEAIYPHLLRAPLPARIYNQGGIPAVIPRLEITGNPNGRLGTYLPDGPDAARATMWTMPVLT